jgi:WD40 repeat protein
MIIRFGTSPKNTFATCSTATKKKFTLDGRLIVSGSGDKTARIWDMIDGTSKVLTINDGDSLNNDHGVTSVAISPNGQFVAAGSLDAVVRIWDIMTPSFHSSTLAV